MKEYLLELAGLFVRLRSEREIEITDRTRPFVIEQKIGKKTSCITLRTCMKVPDIPIEHHRNGMTLYASTETSYQLFYLDEKSGQPFAIVQLYKDGNVTVDYLAEYVRCFQTSSDILNRVCIEKLFSYHNRMILHASFVKYEGRGILFLGPSGIGKSTQARLWEDVLGANVVNGDRAAVGKDEVWTAWGIPYAGTSRIYKNEKALIEAVIILKQGQKNEIEKVRTTQAFASIYPEVSIHHWERQFVEEQMEMIHKLTNDIPIYQYTCVPDESAVHFLRAFLERENYDY